MLARASHSNARSLAYYASEPFEDFAAPELYSGERISPPRKRSGDNVLGLCVVALVALVGGLALLDNREARQRWLAVLTDLLSAARTPEPPAETPSAPVKSANIEQATQQATSEPQPSSPQPLAAREISDAPVPANSTTPTPAAAASAAPTDEPAAPASPPSPPAADPADPYQAKAAAVGLSPDLSRVLLKRLSPADYHNAGVAIETAVAKTPDTGVFAWPRQRKPELALFRVHFVAGAAPDCRRYVVTVTKDGWTTTAPPMEKCGSHVTRRSAKSASVE